MAEKVKYSYAKPYRKSGKASMQLDECDLTRRFEDYCRLKNITRGKGLEMALEYFLDHVQEMELMQLSKEELVSLLMRK